MPREEKFINTSVKKKLYYCPILNKQIIIKHIIPEKYLALNLCNEPFVIHLFFVADWHSLFYCLHTTDSSAGHGVEPEIYKQNNNV